jgi:hypothetical protein
VEYIIAVVISTKSTQPQLTSKDGRAEKIVEGLKVIRPIFESQYIII